MPKIRNSFIYSTDVPKIHEGSSDLVNGVWALLSTDARFVQYMRASLGCRTATAALTLPATTTPAALAPSVVLTPTLALVALGRQLVEALVHGKNVSSRRLGDPVALLSVADP